MRLNIKSLLLEGFLYLFTPLDVSILLPRFIPQLVVFSMTDALLPTFIRIDQKTLKHSENQTLA